MTYFFAHKASIPNAQPFTSALAKSTDTEDSVSRPFPDHPTGDLTTDNHGSPHGQFVESAKGIYVESTIPCTYLPRACTHSSPSVPSTRLVPRTEMASGRILDTRVGSSTHKHLGVLKRGPGRKGKERDLDYLRSKVTSLRGSGRLGVGVVHGWMKRDIVGGGIVVWIRSEGGW